MPTATLPLDVYTQAMSSRKRGAQVYGGDVFTLKLEELKASEILTGRQKGLNIFKDLRSD